MAVLYLQEFLQAREAHKHTIKAYKDDIIDKILAKIAEHASLVQTVKNMEDTYLALMNYDCAYAFDLLDLLTDECKSKHICFKHHVNRECLLHNRGIHANTKFSFYWEKYTTIDTPSTTVVLKSNYFARYLTNAQEIGGVNNKMNKDSLSVKTIKELEDILENLEKLIEIMPSIQDKFFDLVKNPQF